MSNYRNNSLAKAGKNPFDDNDDDLDFKFGNRSNDRRINDTFGTREEEEDLRNIQERIGRVENDSLESTRRALRSLNETHEVGVKTATELVRQGEKLKNIDERLDEVDQTLSATQKNINQIKSIFGGLFSRAPKVNKQTVDKNPIKPSSSFTNNKPQIAQQNESKPQFAVITGSEREKELNDNLDEMSLGLSRLSSLAKEMSFELDRQNPLIDRLGTKVESTNTRINVQNDQMKKILK